MDGRGSEGKEKVRSKLFANLKADGPSMIASKKEGGRKNQMGFGAASAGGRELLSNKLKKKLNWNEE